MTTLKKRGIILIALVALYIVIACLPAPEGLSPEGKNALALMLCGTIALTTNALPIEMVGFLLVVLQAPLHIASLEDAIGRFADSTLFFVLGTIMISVGFNATGLDRRIVLKLTQLTNANPKRLCMVFMVGAGLLSTVFPDLMVVLVLAPIAVQILKENDCTPGNSNLGKNLMIGIPVAALIGGGGTPLGSVMNVLAQGMIKQFLGVEISFLTWSLIGLPIVILTLPIACKALMMVYPIELEELQGMDKIHERMEKLGVMTRQEKIFIVLFATLVVGCGTTSLTGLDTSIIACGIAALMIALGVVDWKTLDTQTSWSMNIAMFGIVALGMTIYATGASDWIAGGIAALLGGQSFLFVVIALGLFAIIIHLLVPVNQALITILIPIAIGLATALDANPIFLALVVAFCVHIAILLPLDIVPLVIFPYGYYKMYEMIKPGIIISILWFAIVLVVLNVIGPLVGVA